MRVCFLTTSFPRWANDPSGTFVHRIAKYLAREPDIDVDVVAPGAYGSRPSERLDGCQVTRFSYFVPARLQRLAYGYGIPDNVRSNRIVAAQLPFFLTAFLVAALRTARDCDVIHAHWTPTGAVGVVVARLLKKPLVVTIWGTDLRRLPDWLNRFVIRRADAVIGFGVEAQAFLSRFDAAGLSIPAPIDLDRFASTAPRGRIREGLGIPSTSSLVTFVARLSPEKDPATFVRAAPQVLRLDPKARFALVGDGLLRSGLEALSRQLGVDNAVMFLGERSDVPDLLNASDVFVACSSVENVWSTTIVEAAQMGVPCVLSDAGHTTEIFQHDRDCLVVPVSDTGKLAEAIVRLIEDPILSERLAEGNRALHHAHGFDVEDIVHRHREVYESSLRHRATGRPEAPR